MSTNSECLFIEVAPDEWFYVLEHTHAPKNAFDWMDNATAYGPFPNEEEAEEDLRRNHANPGGSCSEYYREGRKMSETLSRLVEEARTEKASTRSAYRW